MVKWIKLLNWNIYHGKCIQWICYSIDHSSIIEEKYVTLWYILVFTQQYCQNLEIIYQRARIAQSVKWLAAGWMISLICGRGRHFFFATMIRLSLWHTHPPSQWILGSEADQSPSSSAEVKNMWSFTSVLPYAFMVQCLSTGVT